MSEEENDNSAPKPDWDSFEPYHGPEERPLKPLMRLCVSIVAPILLAVVTFLAGGFLAIGWFLRTFRATSEEEPFPTVLLTFAVGGLVALALLGGTLWGYRGRRK